MSLFEGSKVDKPRGVGQMGIRKISFSDNIAIRERFGTSASRPKGHVVIKTVDKSGIETVVVEKDNLIVLDGRNWLMQRAFNTNYSDSNQRKDLYIGWFSVGSGAATTNDPFNPSPPQETDTDLWNAIVLDASNPSYADGGRKKTYDALVYTDYTTAKLVLVVDYGEGNNNLINEAGLYVADSMDATTVTTFVLFSHVTFPSIYKTATEKIMFEWYFMF